MITVGFIKPISILWYMSSFTFFMYKVLHDHEICKLWHIILKNRTGFNELKQWPKLFKLWAWNQVILSKQIQKMTYVMKPHFTLKSVKGLFKKIHDPKMVIDWCWMPKVNQKCLDWEQKGFINSLWRSSHYRFIGITEMQFWTLRGKNRSITILVTNWGHRTVSDYILLCKWVCQYRPIIGNKFKCSATYKQARRKVKTFNGINSIRISFKEEGFASVICPKIEGQWPSWQPGSTSPVKKISSALASCI